MILYSSFRVANVTPTYRNELEFTLPPNTDEQIFYKLSYILITQYIEHKNTHTLFGHIQKTVLISTCYSLAHQVLHEYYNHLHAIACIQRTRGTSVLCISESH